MKFNPADNIQDLQEFGGKTHLFLTFYLHFPFGKTMFDTFEGNMEGCLYSRHSSSNLYLDKGWPQ
jgi:methionine-gamma-lyase